MSISRFRDIEEATPLVATPLDPENLRIVFELSALCIRLAPRVIERGVHRYRTIEERAASEPL